MKTWIFLGILITVCLSAMSQELYINKTDLFRLDSLEQLKNIKDRRYIEIDHGTFHGEGLYVHTKPNRDERKQGMESQTILIRKVRNNEFTSYNFPYSALRFIEHRDSVSKYATKMQEERFAKMSVKQDEEERNREKAERDWDSISNNKQKPTADLYSAKSYAEMEFDKYDLENEGTGQKETIYASIVVLTNENPLFDADSLFLSVPIRRVSDRTKFKIIKQYKFKQYGLDAQNYLVGDERTRILINFIIAQKYTSINMDKTINTLSVTYSSQ